MEALGLSSSVMLVLLSGLSEGFDYCRLLDGAREMVRSKQWRCVCLMKMGKRMIVTFCFVDPLV